MTTAHPKDWWRVSRRALALGLTVGVLTWAVAVGGEVLGLFNCISAWLVETVVFTLILVVAARPCRVLAVGSATLLAYFGIIAHVVIHGVRSGSWKADDNLPVLVTFFLLMLLPTAFAFGIDFAFFIFRHAQKDA